MAETWFVELGPAHRAGVLVSSLATDVIHYKPLHFDFQPLFTLLRETGPTKFFTFARPRRLMLQSGPRPRRVGK